jgi:phosphatidate cytidylyltransferase
MKTRILTALVALPILIASIILPAYIPQQGWANWLFLVLAALALVAGLYEFFLLSKKLELKADAQIAFLGGTAFFIAFLFDAPAKAPDLLLITSVLFLMLVFISQMFRFQADFSKMIAGVGVTVLGVFYVVFLGGFLVSMRVGFEDKAVLNLSTKLLGYFFLVNMGSDVGAYFAGSNFGKYKIAPKISPGKTWEGFVGGVLMSMAFATLATLWFFPELPYKVSIPLAAVMAVVGVGGDLAESALKRGAGTKDAANILPGHGGLLDRLDSLLFNAPILYYFARFYF